MNMGERIYVSKEAGRRLNSLRRTLKADPVKESRVCRVYDYDLLAMLHVIDRITLPTLSEYIKLSEIMSWDLSRDVNLNYSQGGISSEELLRRLRRVLRITSRVNTLCWLVSREVGYTGEWIRDTVLHKKGEKVDIYSRVVLWLMRQERKEGYSDALDFEE